MANNFCFLFYPGDYLRDTQCLSEGAQVAYDRIICEHMRNICITQQQLNFFTKRLDLDEKEGLLNVLNKSSDGYSIEWVVKSIAKRRDYSESRSKNRVGKTKKHMLTHEEDMKNISEHMEIEKEKVIEEEKELNIPFSDFWDLYDKKVGDKEKLKKKWDALKGEEREQAMWHIPRYKVATPDKQFRKDPSTYLNNKSFNDEIIQPNGQSGAKTPSGRNAGTLSYLDSLAARYAPGNGGDNKG